MAMKMMPSIKTAPSAVSKATGPEPRKPTTVYLVKAGGEGVRGEGRG